MAEHHVTVGPLPPWFEPQPLLGPGSWAREGGHWQARLPTVAAADLAARLRGVVLAGSPIECRVQPGLKRRHVRQAATDEARRKWKSSPGFSRSGVRTDDTSKRWLTPEALAERLAARPSPGAVVDACCGLGGNSIAFARGGWRVTAIDVDPRMIAMARHNAEVYGVAQAIEFIEADAEALVPTLSGDVLFVDPPWGPEYRAPTALEDYPLLASLLGAAAGFREVWAKVPPSFDPDSVVGATAEPWYGVASGDDRRVKFLMITVAAGSNT